MGLPLLDLLVALFFLLSLVVVARFRTEIRMHDAESYRFLSGGLSVLAVVALTRIYGGMGLFASVPFLSVPLFFNLINWIGIIMGATFVVSGVSTWLPIARVNRQMGLELVQRLELIKRVEQLIMVETRRPEVLCTTLDYMVELTGLAWGAVYSFSADASHATLLSTSGGAGPEVAALRQIVCTEDDFLGSEKMESSDTSNIARKLSSLMPPPNLVLPLISGDRVCGAFLLWSSTEGVSDKNEIRVNLKIAVDVIARQMDLDAHRTEAAISNRCRRFRRSLEEAIDPALELKENFIALARLMNSHLHADHVSFAIASDSGLVRRLTIGSGRTLLDEVGLDLRAKNSHIDQVLKSGEPLMIANLKEASSLPVSDLVVAGGIHSIMAIPVTHRSHRQGVLTIGSRESDVFDERHRQVLQAVIPIFSELIIADEHSRTLSEIQRRFSVVEGFLNEVGAVEDLQTAFQQAANLIRSELDCSMVRIATFNHDGVFLRSRAFAHEKKVYPTIPHDGHMVMSLMPLHRQVRDRGQVLLIEPGQNQTLIAAEANQAFFSEAQRVMLIPIIVGHQVLAVISVANAHRSDRCRYLRADILLTRSIAGALSLAIRTELNRGALRNRGENDQVNIPPPTSRLRGQVNSSLSGILGSLEMIKAQQKPSDPELDKYLSIIDKSAHRIHEYVTQPTPE